MELLWMLFCWLSFALSLCGWFALLARFPGVNKAFLPVITLSGLSVFLFTFGLLHMLRPAAVCLFVGGLALLVYGWMNRRREGFSFDFLRSPGVIFFFVASALFIPILYGAHYYHYDNFSHWATVLEEMFAFNDFPTAETIVVFRDYAPGTASFLYLFGSVVGKSEGVILMGQAMLSCAALSALFFRVEKVRSFRFAATALLALTLTCMLVFDDGTLQVYNLLVDALIGFVAAAAWFIREEYRQTPFRGWILMIPVLTFLVLIKLNSAVLLVFFAFFAVYDAFRFSRPLRVRLFCLLPLALPLLWIVFWRFYRQDTYGVHTDSYGFSVFDRIDSLPSEFFLSIFRQTWDKMTDLSNIFVSAYLAVNVLLIFGWILLRVMKKNRIRILRTFLIVNALMIGYTLCMVFLYCFIMSVGESSYLAAFERYMVTPLILVSAIGVESLFDIFSTSLPQKMRYRVSLLLMSLLFFCFTAKNALQLVNRPDFSVYERGQVLEVLEDAAPQIPRNAAVALYNGDRGRKDLYYYLVMFEVKSRWVFILDFGRPQYSIPIDVNMLQEYQYLVVASQDAALREALVNAGFVVRWQEGCTLYRIRTDGYGRMVVAPASE